jgi:hypothetical protein
MRGPSPSPGHPWLSRVAAGGLIALALASSAAAAGWHATRVHGIVLLLEGQTWSDLSSGAQLPDHTTVRTLGRGQLEIAGTGVELVLYNGAATELSQSGDDVDMVLHAGSVDLRVLTGHVVHITTASGSITLGEGRVRVWRDGDVTGIDAITGSHEVFDAAGNWTPLAPGQAAHVAVSGVTIAALGNN